MEDADAEMDEDDADQDGSEEDQGEEEDEDEDDDDEDDDDEEDSSVDNSKPGYKGKALSTTRRGSRKKKSTSRKLWQQSVSILKLRVNTLLF